MRAGLAGSVGSKPGDNPRLWGLSRVQPKLGLEVQEVLVQDWTTIWSEALWSWTRPGPGPDWFIDYYLLAACDED